MLEQIPLLLATPIAMAILDKFYEGVGSKLGERATEVIPQKVQQIGQFIWDRCLRQKPGAEAVLRSAANGSEEEQKKLTEYLHKALDENLPLRQEAQKLSEDIHQIIQLDDVNAINLQQVFDGQGLQVNDPKSQVIQAGENAQFYFGVTSAD